jgi:phosphoribosylglycinamide formyltransferase-1
MTAAKRLRVAVLISGSGTNLQAIIDAAAAGDLEIDIVGVISDRPKAYGLERAANAGITAMPVDFKSFDKRADFDAALADKLAELAPDLVVLAGYMRILPAATVNDYRGRMLNIHPSLLPDFPGLDTYARALAAGKKSHGTTVHFVTPELDSGPAIIQYRVPIRGQETEPELRERVQAGEYIIYPQAIGLIAAGRVTLDGDSVCLDGKPLEQPIIIEEQPC